jgi:GT2 family glycosyltransferase
MREDSSKILRKLRTDFPVEELHRLKEQIEQPMLDDGEIARVEIILLKYKSPELENECIGKLIDNTTHPYKLTVFDNRGNTGNTSRAWNKLIKESSCNLVCIMDTDAFVEDHWLEPLVECFANHQDCILAVPVIEGTAGGYVQQRRRAFEDPFSTKDHVSGFCFLTRKDYIKDIGWYDEDFYIFGQDSDMCNRVINHPKYNMYVCPKSLVYHGDPKRPETTFSQSTRKAYEEGEFNWTVDTRYAPRLCEHKLLNYRIKWRTKS